MEFRLQLVYSIFLLVEHDGVVFDVVLDRLFSLQLNIMTIVPFSEFLLQLADHVLHIWNMFDELLVVLSCFFGGSNLQIPLNITYLVLQIQIFILYNSHIFSILLYNIESCDSFDFKRIEDRSDLLLGHPFKKSFHLREIIGLNNAIDEGMLLLNLCLQ